MAWVGWGEWGGVSSALAQLYAVTGDGGPTPEFLYEVNPATGATTFLAALGNGTDGEEILYHAGLDRLYHFSGIGPINADQIMEWIDPVTLAVTPVTMGGAAAEQEIKGGVYVPPNRLAGLPGGGMIVGNRDSELYSVAADGTFTLLVTLPFQPKALAFAGGALYAVAGFTADLHTLDGTTFLSTGSVTITFNGEPINRGIGLAFDQMSQTLYAIVQTGDQSNTRRLVTLDPLTGVATDIGALNVAGLSYRVPNTSCSPVFGGRGGAVEVFAGDMLTGDLSGLSHTTEVSCDGNPAGATPDAWYSFTAPQAGTLLLNTFGSRHFGGLNEGADTVLSFSSFCPPLAGGTPHVCNDDAGGNDSSLAYIMGAGEHIVIRVGTYSDALFRVGNGRFILNVDFDPAAPACECETDGDDAQVNVFDLLAYLDLWFAQDPAADIDEAAGVDVFDLLAFLDCWFPASAGEAC